MDTISDIQEETDNDESQTNTDYAKPILEDALNTSKVIETSDKLLTQSPLLKKDNMIFLEFAKSLQIHSNKEAREDEHEKRLDDLIHTCGLIKLPVPKDGDCCFSAVSLGLKILNNNSNPELKSNLNNLPLNIHQSVETMGEQLRQMVYREWCEHEEYYQEFVPENVTAEARKFLARGFFMSSLGDTLVAALSNTLGISIIVLSSIPGSPILQFKPRSYSVHAPIVISYNQFGAGHYDGVSYINKDQIHKNVRSQKMMCKCGVNDKEKIDRCCPSTQYGNRCPCFKKSMGCSKDCLCKHCGNPCGKKPTMSVKGTRTRHQSKLRLTHLNNTE